MLFCFCRHCFLTLLFLPCLFQSPGMKLTANNHWVDSFFWDQVNHF
jgi:hypothetical protein